MKKYNIIIAVMILLIQSCSVEYPKAPVIGVTEPGEDEYSNADITLNIDMNTNNGKISNMLTGVNLLYCFEKDKLWKDDADKKMVNYLKKMRTGVLRYPGGKIVESWHWDNPNGQFSQDTWNPEYKESDTKPGSEFMNLDEYMDLVKELNAEPLIGINITSGKKWKNDVQESVKEAKALVSHCMESGFNVKYYYIGNEPYHSGAIIELTASEYADEIIRFADAIHEVDPTAKIVANWDRNVTSASMGTLLQKAGKKIDVMEIHWYWSHGTASWDMWKSQIPMSAKNQWYTAGKPHYDEVTKFNEFANKFGCGHIKFASLEWNIGPSANDKSVPNEYQMALMQGEMLMQFMQGGLCMATFWPLHYENSSDLRYMLDANNQYKPRYTIDVLSMIAKLEGGTMISSTSTSNELYSVVSKHDNGEINIALLNKNTAARKCAFKIKGEYNNNNILIETYSKAEEEGKAIITTDAQPEFDKDIMLVDLPAYSITVITIK